MNIAPLVVYAVLGLLVGMLRLLLEAPVLLTRYFLRKERGRKIYLVVCLFFFFLKLGPQAWHSPLMGRGAPVRVSFASSIRNPFPVLWIFATRDPGTFCLV